MTQEAGETARRRHPGPASAACGGPTASRWTRWPPAATEPVDASRIKTGHRRIARDQLVAIARALDATVDQLVEPVDADDVVIRPRHDIGHGTPSPGC